MKAYEIKALLKLDGMAWEEEIGNVEDGWNGARPWKYWVRIKRPNSEYGHVTGWNTLEGAWQKAWRRYEDRRNESTPED